MFPIFGSDGAEFAKQLERSLLYPILCGTMVHESTPRSRRGSLLIVGTAVLWGTTGTAQALGPDTSDPRAIGDFRLVVAAAALTIIATRSSETSPGQLRRPATLAAAQFR